MNTKDLPEAVGVARHSSAPPVDEASAADWWRYRPFG